MKVIINRANTVAVDASVIDTTGHHFIVNLVHGQPPWCGCRKPNCGHVAAVLEYLAGGNV